MLEADLLEFFSWFSFHKATICLPSTEQAQDMHKGKGILRHLLERAHDTIDVLYAPAKSQPVSSVYTGDSTRTSDTNASDPRDLLEQVQNFAEEFEEEVVSRMQMLVLEVQTESEPMDQGKSS